MKGRDGSFTRAAGEDRRAFTRSRASVFERRGWGFGGLSGQKASIWYGLAWRAWRWRKRWAAAAQKAPRTTAMSSRWLERRYVRRPRRCRRLGRHRRRRRHARRRGWVAGTVAGPVAAGTIGGAGGVLGGAGGAGGTMAGAGGMMGGAGGTMGGAGGGGGAPPAMSAGCGKADTPGSDTFMIDVAGLQREYIVKIPADYDPSHPYRLIFTWHYLGGSAAGIAGGFGGGYYGLESRSEGTAIFVSPEGIDARVANTAAATSRSAAQMVEWMRGELLHRQRAHLLHGFSYGGIMSNTAAVRWAPSSRDRADGRLGPALVAAAAAWRGGQRSSSTARATTSCPSHRAKPAATTGSKPTAARRPPRQARPRNASSTTAATTATPSSGENIRAATPNRASDPTPSGLSSNSFRQPGEGESARSLLLVTAGARRRCTRVCELERAPTSVPTISGPGAEMRRFQVAVPKPTSTLTNEARTLSRARRSRTRWLLALSLSSSQTSSILCRESRARSQPCCWVARDSLRRPGRAFPCCRASGR